MDELGLQPEKHHHEVAPAQHELGMKFNTLLNMADNMQLYKYIVHNVAHAYGKTATFMPKPMWNDNGTGMHIRYPQMLACHLSRLTCEHACLFRYHSTLAWA